MQFVAIDFETANTRADSACQLAAVVVEGGKIVHEQSWLIRPPRLYFSPRNIAIHGIRPKDVCECGTMEDVWREFQPLMDGQVLIAHNARFDIGVLQSSLAAFEIALPDLEFNCTRALARGAWPGRSSYGLKPLGTWLDIPFRHHDALEDARCCARIALAVAQTCQQPDLPGLETALRLRRGTYRQGQINSPRKLGASRGGAASSGAGSTWGRTTADRWGFPLKSAKAGVDAQAVLTASDGQRPLSGRNIVFLGPLRGLSMAETAALTERLGATFQTTITPSTNYVVACGGTLEAATHIVCESLAKYEPTPNTSTQLASTQVTSTPGTTAQGIRLLSERQFLALIPGGKASTRT